MYFNLMSLGPQETKRKATNNRRNQMRHVHTRVARQQLRDDMDLEDIPLAKI